MTVYLLEKVFLIDVSSFHVCIFSTMNVYTGRWPLSNDWRSGPGVASTNSNQTCGLV